MSLNIVKMVDTASEDVAFQNYLNLRPHILKMMEENNKTSGAASAYWEEEMAGFDYMLDASPLLIRKLREHCYHITGIRSYEYRVHHSHAAPPFAAKLEALRKLDMESLFVPESPMMGGFGHIINNVLVNIDTLKFYESLIALNRAGLLAEFKKKRSVALEVGAGWGGFAYQFKTLFPNSTYIIVDLPPTMLFSATYLTTQFPNAKIFMYGCDDVKLLKTNLLDYDFVFIPHYAFLNIELSQLDLGINMVSFQEMTTEQVSDYMQKIATLGCKALYSHNRDRSKHNNQLTSVSDLLKSYYDAEEIKVLPVPYTNLNIAVKVSKKGKTKKKILLAIARDMKRKILAMPVIGKNRSGQFDYRHLVGKAKI